MGKTHKLWISSYGLKHTKRCYIVYNIVVKKLILEIVLTIKSGMRIIAFNESNIVPKKTVKGRRYDWMG